MAKSSRRPVPNGTPTLIFGIVFTVVGGGLLVQSATGVDVWKYLWRLWPMLLVIMGVKALVDYYCYHESRPKEQP